MRVGLEDDLAPPPPPRPQGPPLHVAIVGGLCGTAGLILTLLGVIQSTRSESNLAELLAGSSWRWSRVSASMRAFSSSGASPSKLLMLALALGVAVDLIGLIAFPIIQRHGRRSRP